MHAFKIFAFLPAMAWAITVVNPAMNATIDISKGFTITYTTVNTDPSSATIALDNQATYPEFNVILGTNVDLSSGSFSVPQSLLQSVTNRYGYRINFLSTSNGGILAQSNQFTISGAGSSSSSSSSSSSASASSSSSASRSSASSSSSAAASSSSASASSSGSSTATSSGPVASKTGNAASVNAANAGGVAVAFLAGVAALL